MNPTDLYAHLERRLRDALPGWDDAQDQGQVGPARDLAFGDAAFPCFQLAKRLRQAPAALAEEAARRMPPDEVLEWARPQGAFLNLRFRRARLAEAVCRAALEGLPPVGPQPPTGRTVVVDFSSPNIAKPFHLGHLRSTVIGSALRRLHAHAGHKVAGVNHIGDWGSQFGKIITAWKRWGSEEELARHPMRHLFDVYVRYQKEETPELAAESAECFRRLESGEDNEERRIWRRLRDVSLAAFEGPYRRLGVEFDAVAGESFYEDKVEDAVRRVVESGIASESEGALVVDLSDKGMPPLILRKSDGTTIYATRDLAALFYRHETYRFHRALYVVGGEQRLHFQQLKETLRRMKVPWAEAVEHVDFGLILFRNEETGRWEKGRTRAGNVIFLDEVLDEAVAKVERVIAEKNPDLRDRAAVAEQVGVSAIVFNDLKTARVKDVRFDWDEMLSFEGDTGPYVQYAGARLCGILRNAGVSVGDVEPGSVDYSLLADAERVLLAMLDLGPTLERAAARNEPSLLAGLMLRVAGEIHSYLRDHHVLRADPPLRSARLALVAGARRVLERGLGLLGVAAPEEM